MLSRTLTLAVVLLVVLSGCGSQPAQQAVRIPVGSATIARDAVVWSRGKVLHVDDATIDVGRVIDALAPARGGVYFLASGRMWFTDLERVRPTPVRGILDLHTSADGRYLGVIDFDHGPRDRFDTRRAAVLVLDTTTGRTVLRDESRMGSLDEDDLADLYEDSSPQVIGFGVDDDAAVYAAAALGDTLRYPLDGSRPTVLPQGTEPRVDIPTGPVVGSRYRTGRVTLRPTFDEGDAAYLSPSGDTMLAQAADGAQRLFDTHTGRPVRPLLTSGQFSIGRWTGPDTFYGIPYDVTGNRKLGIVSCTRGEVRCTPLVPPSALAGDNVALHLATGDGT